jgi:hypothetical protein
MPGMGSNGTGIGANTPLQLPPSIMQLLMARGMGQGGGMAPQGGGMAPPPGMMPPQAAPGGGGMGPQMPQAQPVQQPQNLMQQMGGLPAMLQMLQRQQGQAGLQPQMPGAQPGGGWNPQAGPAMGAQNPNDPGMLRALLMHMGLMGGMPQPAAPGTGAGAGGMT